MASTTIHIDEQTMMRAKAGGRANGPRLWLRSQRKLPGDTETTLEFTNMADIARLITELQALQARTERDAEAQKQFYASLIREGESDDERRARIAQGFGF
jgi:hypothetical protein